MSGTMDNARETLRLRLVCLGIEVGFKLLSERGNKRGLTSPIRKNIPNMGASKEKL